MKILVTGSRDFTDRFIIDDQLNKLPTSPRLIVIHGGARGADQMASSWCRRHPSVYEVGMNAKWLMLGGSAGPARNRAMIELVPDKVLAFFKIGAVNQVTRNMVNVALQSGMSPSETLQPYEVGDVTEFWA